MTVLLISLFVAVFGGGTALAIHQQLKYLKRQQRQLADSWSNSCQALSLSFQKGPFSDRNIGSPRHLREMYGQHEDADVYVGCRIYTTGPIHRRVHQYFTYVDVMFPALLKRGLSITPGRVFLQSLFGQRDIEIGVPTIDRKFDIRGCEPERVRWLLNDPTLRDLLSQNSRFEFDINDDRVRVEAFGYDFSTEQLRDAIQRAVSAFHRIVALTGEGTAATEAQTRFSPVGQQLSNALGFDFNEAEMALTGTLRDHSCAIEVHVHQQQWTTELLVFFSPPLVVNLSLYKSDGKPPRDRGQDAQEITTGHTAFDAAFVITGSDPNRVRDILSDEAIEALLLLDSHGLLHVCNRWVAVAIEGVATSANAIERALIVLCDAAAAMTAFRVPPSFGPYR